MDTAPPPAIVQDSDWLARAEAQLAYMQTLKGAIQTQTYKDAIRWSSRTRCFKQPEKETK